eukprot:11101819-Heterocapsa_arctica.AAC.1
MFKKKYGGIGVEGYRGIGIDNAYPGFSGIFETPPMWVVGAFAQSAQLRPQRSAMAPGPYRTLLQ